MTLRDYQTDAIAATFDSICRQQDPLIVHPTGAGKSVVQAGFIQRILKDWPTERFLIIAHVQELLAQNGAALARLLPGLSVGYYSAGLGKKDLGYQVTIAGIQSVYKHAHRVGDISIVIVDEAHLVSKARDTMYQKFFTELRKFCPQVRVVGMTATPYRLDGGPLHKGQNRIFTEVAHSVSMKDLIEQGYLSPLMSAKTKTKANTDGIRTTAGEFNLGELESAMNVDELTARALDEAMVLAADRVSWIVFCVGVDHAQAVNAALLARGVASAVVTGDTIPLERERHLADFKAHRLRALVSVGVLTTGFDAPSVDAMLILRPTKSPGLHVQICGRGTRLHSGKENCLVLDYTDNTRTHGPVDLITIDGDGELRTSPMMDCEKCGDETPKAVAKCIVCGHVRGQPCPQCKVGTIPIGSLECADCGFIRPIAGVGREVKHRASVGGGQLISGENQTVNETVESWAPKRHQKDGSPDSLCVQYYGTGLIGRREWVCFEHEGYAGKKAGHWWAKHGGKNPAPKTVTEAMERWRELTMPTELVLKKEGKFWQIVRAVVPVAPSLAAFPGRN